MHSVAVSSARLREELTPVIESKELSLPNLQKSYLRLRWLEQTLLMNSRYRRAMRGYYALRVLTVVGALLILLLASLTVAAPGDWHAYTRGLTIFFSLLVAGCVTIEHLFDLGESHRRYERVAERLRAEGWRFLQLSGPYQSYGSHTEAFAAFANQVEALSQTDVEVYNFDVVGQRAAEPRPREEEPPKKFFPLEGVEPTGSPAVTHRAAVGHHTSQQRVQ